MKNEYKGKILFICGSLNQTTIMHQIGIKFNEYDCYYTPYYGDWFLNALAKIGLLDFTILGGNFKKQTLNYLLANHLKIDFGGQQNDYDLVYTCTDMLVPKNIRRKKVILVQEGMTDPENIFYYLVKYLKIPRYLASTSTTGLSNKYEKFCVASEGYKKLFTKKGIKAEKIEVTGIPNFDNCKSYFKNNFPYRDYVLVATSDARETFKYENRKKFIKKAIEIASGRQIIFKLHPNENYKRAIKEIKSLVPDALIFTDCSINEMIANCSTLITKYSSVVYIGIALGKQVYSDFNLDTLHKISPIQNDGKSAMHIAKVGIKLLIEEKKQPVDEKNKSKVTIQRIISKFHKPVLGV
jgi:hypothetical protein